MSQRARHYVIFWTPPAQRDVMRLPAKSANAVLNFVENRLGANPHQIRKPLGGDLADLRSARNGNYRVLFEIDDVAGGIRVVRVSHRAHAYRRR